MTRRAEKDLRKLTLSSKRKLHDVLTEVIAPNPFCGKKLVGDLSGSYAYRLSYKDRIVYSVDTTHKIVYVERAATHYGD